jgi:hypothetical protein
MNTSDRETSLKIMNDYRERQVERDSIVEAYKVALGDMVVELDSIKAERDLYRVKVDGTLVVIENLTNPVATEETINEALEWIEQYNDTL